KFTLSELIMSIVCALMFCFLLIFSILIEFSLKNLKHNTLESNNLIAHVVLNLGLAFCIYFLFFYIFDIDFTYFKQFLNLIKIENMIKISLSGIIFYTLFAQFNSHNFYYSENLTEPAKIFLLIGSLLGAFCELKLRFYNNYYFYSKYNIEAFKFYEFE